ncbi:MAG: hypothetical protein GX211_00225 [Clostridiaceae bacterium]|nr:hypothetical protein [Clostridiaceae bacterium]
MRKYNKKLPLVIFIIIATIASLLPVISSADQEDESFRIDVEGGFNGIGKLGAWAPLHIKVLSKEKDISGEIQIEANLDQSRKVIIAKPVEMITGVEYEFYFEVPVVSAHRSLDIRLVDKKKTVAEADFKFTRLLPPEIMLIGVLSEDPSAFGWLGGKTIPVALNVISDEKMKLMIAAGEIPPSAVQSSAQGTNYDKKEAVVVPLDRDTFPEKSEVMDSFDYLVVSKYDTGLLNREQAEVLEKWVDTGGTLIIGTGLNWQKVYNGLPDSLKPFKITGMADIDSTAELEKFTGREVPQMVLKLAAGEKGFEYYPPDLSSVAPGIPPRFIDNDIVAGSDNNPLVIKYRKERGHILVLTFEPASEPFVSWRDKTTFFDFMLRHVDTSVQRFYEYGNGYYQKQVYGSSIDVKYLAREIPSDKKPPFVLMFVCLIVYIILAGPVLYLVLKKFDRRDWAWFFIPALAVVFLAGMYLFGYKSRYHTAITNTVSLIQAPPGSSEAQVTSVIGVFNNRRGTLKMEYPNDNGIETPFVLQEDYYYYMYRPVTDDSGGQLIGKYTTGDRTSIEQYDVMLWTPTVLNAKKTVPFAADLLKNIYIKSGKLKGEVVNTTQFDLLDAVIVIGNNIIPVGDIYSGETLPLDVSFDGNNVYKQPEEYLDSEFCRSYYRSLSDYPENFAERIKRRRIFENVIYNLFNNIQGNNRFMLLARNEQEIDYGFIINGKEPQKYSQSLVVVENNLEFKSGEEVEIPGGIITPSYYTGDVGWYEGVNGIRVNNIGQMEFVFTLPGNLEVSEMRLSVEGYLPLYMKYRMVEEANDNYKFEVLENEYEYYLYNTETYQWDEIENNSTVTENPDKYIGAGGEVRMMIKVVSLAQETKDLDDQGVYKEYMRELLSVPEISLKGVAR